MDIIKDLRKNFISKPSKGNEIVLIKATGYYISLEKLL